MQGIIEKNRAGADRFVNSFPQFHEAAAGAPGSSFRSLRRAGIARFAELGFPTRRHEEWRFTNVAPISATEFDLPQGTPQDRLTQAEFEKIREEILGASNAPLLVFVDAQFCPEFSQLSSLPEGVVLSSLAEAVETHPEAVDAHVGQYATIRDAAFTALNTAFLHDGAFLCIPNGRLIEDPICLLFISTSQGRPAVSHPRSLILAGDSSQFTLLEAYVGLGSTFTNAVTEVVVGENSSVDHTRIQQDSDDGFHVSTLQALLRGNTKFSSRAFTFGGRIVRNDVRAMLDGEGGECTLNGIYLGSGDQLIDNHTSMDHAKPHCASHEVYHGVLSGKASGVFNGKILVRPCAQKTDAKQTNRTLLLSDGASIDTKPQLEIFADDVKCTHGATIGQLDEEAIFYLRSRGLGREQATNLLTFAFANEIVEQVRVESVRSRLEKRIFAWLSQAQGMKELR